MSTPTPTPTSGTPTLRIRPIKPSDTEVIARICLLSANHGISAEPLHNYKELCTVVWALPYLKLKDTFGWVVVIDIDGEEGKRRGMEESGVWSEVVGYLSGTTDSEGFVRSLEEEWYPHYRAKYPLVEPPITTTTTTTTTANDTDAPQQLPRTKTDQDYIKMIHDNSPQPPEVLAWSPVHIHINLLPSAQRKGWGRKLMGKVASYIRERQSGEIVVKELKGWWNGIDPANEEARKFYLKIGGKQIFTSKGVEYYLHDLDNWVDE